MSNDERTTGVPSGLAEWAAYQDAKRAGGCGCACTSGGFCGGCGHAGCGGRRR